jgi:hypothetical protein
MDAKRFLEFPLPGKKEYSSNKFYLLEQKLVEAVENN